MKKSSLTVIALKSGLVLLLLMGIPFPAAFALVITDAEIMVSNFTIVAPGLTFSPIDVEALVVSASNSLGESASNGNTGTDTDVSADAVVSFAHGHAEAKAAAGTAKATVAISLPGLENSAAVTSPGSLASLSGTFGFTGVAGIIDVVFSMDVSGFLHGFAGQVGMFTVDADASLEIDGTPVLFMAHVLAGGPNFPDATQMFAETLTATVSLDSSFLYFYFVAAHVDAGTSNGVPEPGSLALILAGLGVLGCYRGSTRRAAR